MKKVSILLLLLVVLSGCSWGLTGDRGGGLIHTIQSESVRTVNPEAVFSSEDFRTAENITAESIAENKGHQVVLAQIKDREQFHVHDRHDLLVMLKDGEGFLRTKTQTVQVKPGDWAIVPRGVPHQFVTTSEKPARAVVVRTPPVKKDRRPVKR
ncbi:MAG: cupin domain-containing protein [bacterium]